MKAPLLTTLLLAATALTSRAQNADRVRETMSSPYDGRLPVTMSYRLPAPVATNLAGIDTTGWDNQCKTRGHTLSLNLMRNITNSPALQAQWPFWTHQAGREISLNGAVEFATQVANRTQLERLEDTPPQMAYHSVTLTPVVRAGVSADYVRIPLFYTPANIEDPNETHADLYLRTDVGAWHVFNMQDMFDRELNYTTGEVTETPVEELSKQGIYANNLACLSLSSNLGGRGDRVVLAGGMQSCYSGGEITHKPIFALTFAREFGR